MSTHISTVLDISTYEWIKINHQNPSQFSNCTEKEVNKTRLVAKWRINDRGKLYCDWSSC